MYLKWIIANKWHYLVQFLIEKLVADIIISFLQHGFRKHRSVESTAEKFDFIYWEHDRDKYVVSVLIDLSNAFDCVDIDILRKQFTIWALEDAY